MQSILTPVENILKNPKNPRIIKDKQFKELVNSIKSFPEMLEIRPIVANSDGIILGGNMRFEACKAAGLKEVPVVFVDNLSERQQEEFIIKDNVSGGEFNWEQLANEWDLNELSEWGLDCPEIKKQEAKEDDYEPELQVETSICEGDVYKIGNHFLMCGNSFNSDHVQKLMKNEKASIVFTDPPYDLEDEEYVSNIYLFTQNAHVFVMHDDRGIVEYLRKSKLLFKQFFVANFQFSSPRGNDPYLNHILVSHEVNGDAIKHQNLHDGIGSIIKLEYRFRNKEEKFGHKHQKPINFISTFITHYSQEGMICLDLFGGSGSTMATCQQLNRICYTMELEPKNCQIIINRMTSKYNLTAELLNSNV